MWMDSRQTAPLENGRRISDAAEVAEKDSLQAASADGTTNRCIQQTLIFTAKQFLVVLILTNSV